MANTTVITNSAKETAPGVLGGLNLHYPTITAFGTGTTTPSATDTAMQAQVTSSSGSVSTITTTLPNDTLSVVSTYTNNTAGVVPLTELGLIDTNGVLYLHSVFDVQNLQINDQITITQNIQIS